MCTLLSPLAPPPTHTHTRCRPLQNVCVITLSHAQITDEGVEELVGGLLAAPPGHVWVVDLRNNQIGGWAHDVWGALLWEGHCWQRPGNA